MPLSEEQDKSRSGAVPIKGASIRHGKHSSKAGRVSSPWMEERVGKSPVAELLEDVVGAHALRHLRELRLGKFFLQARERLHLL
jgi:hypothetical protein